MSFDSGDSQLLRMKTHKNAPTAKLEFPALN